MFIVEFYYGEKKADLEKNKSVLEKNKSILGKTSLF